ncbi:MAG: amidohydrolase family protein, partial [Longimicrobiales bacterium]
MRNHGLVIDFHNHFYPTTYLDDVRAGPSNVRFTLDTDGNPVLHYPGDYNVVVPGHRDITHRTSTLEEHGVDCQVLTFTSPGTHVEPPDRAVQLARSVNDAFAEIVAAHAGRFTALATLPLNAPQAAALELERAMTELHMPGAM